MEATPFNSVPISPGTLGRQWTFAGLLTAIQPCIVRVTHSFFYVRARFLFQRYQLSHLNQGLMGWEQRQRLQSQLHWNTSGQEFFSAIKNKKGIMMRTNSSLIVTFPERIKCLVWKDERWGRWVLRMASSLLCSPSYKNFTLWIECVWKHWLAAMDTSTNRTRAVRVTSGRCMQWILKCAIHSHVFENTFRLSQPPIHQAHIIVVCHMFYAQSSPFFSVSLQSRRGLWG